jgi:hypothetical protein
LEYTLAIQPIKRATTFATNLDQACVLKHTQMPRRSWPTMLEACGQVARGQFVTQVAEKKNDIPARLVRERGEHDLGISGRDSRHAG